MDKIYSFRRSCGRTHHTFYIRKSGITIVGTCAGGGGTIKLSDEEKIKRVAKEASAQDLLSIRMVGLTAIANQIRAKQLVTRPKSPLLPWKRRRSISRFANTRGQTVVPLKGFQNLK